MSAGKIVLQGKIELLSAALPGSGNAENSDADVMVNKHRKPFIPATAFLGAIRHCLDHSYRRLPGLWGFTQENRVGRQSPAANVSWQSAVNCADLTLVEGNNASVVVRDGIKINNTCGIVVDKKKYDYEVVDAGAQFSLHMEFSWDDGNKSLPAQEKQDITKDSVEKTVATIVQLLQVKPPTANGQIRIGAKTNNGLGKITLREAKILVFDFAKKTDVLRWLKQDFAAQPAVNLDTTPWPRTTNQLVIEVALSLKNSLIIRSYSVDPHMPDAVHMQSAGKHVLTGSSFKGALRARAEKIANTLGKPPSLIHKLFGNVDGDSRSSDASKGRLHVEEIFLPASLASEAQTRIKIDRFTSGTIESALFDTMPVFAKSAEPIRNIRITIEHCREHEIGLVLLVLKDLWTGDLAIGGEKNVGRGVFAGKEAVITMKDLQATIQDNNGKLEIAPPEAKDKLENFVASLVNYTEGANHDQRAVAENH
jgi:CRISPR/Cas system CSM-associated protein Csm3 (group 7 of RAMP superfamily)